MHIPSLLIQTEISWEANLLMPFCFHCVQEFANSDVLVPKSQAGSAVRFLIFPILSYLVQQGTLDLSTQGKKEEKWGLQDPETHLSCLEEASTVQL